MQTYASGKRMGQLVQRVNGERRGKSVLRVGLIHSPSCFDRLACVFYLYVIMSCISTQGYCQLTWNNRPSGEYVETDRSYPVPMEDMVEESEWGWGSADLEQKVDTGVNFQATGLCDLRMLSVSRVPYDPNACQRGVKRKEEWR